MNTKNVNSLQTKKNIIISLVLCLCIYYSYFITIKTGMVIGANPDVDKTIQTYRDQAKKQLVYEGIFVDSNDVPITIPGEEPGDIGLCQMPNAYGYLIGFESSQYGSSGLRKIYASQLWKNNTTIKLTTDNDLQEKAYELLAGNVGSIILMENKSGRVLALAARGDESIDFNVNAIDEKYEEYASINEFFYNRALFAADPPGSTFKIVTAASMIENGLGDLVYNDTGEYNGIHNAGNKSYGELDLTTAIEKSSNTYFAYAGDMLGGFNLEETAKKFQFGETTELDFGTLSSNFELEYHQKNLICQTAFGQGKTMVSPLNVLLTLQAVINDGKMIKPYVVNKINKKKKGKSEVLSKVMKESTSKELKVMLNKAAISYGLGNDMFAKTGTATVTGKENHTWMVFGNEKYSGIISIENTTTTSKSLSEKANQLMDSLKVVDERKSLRQ